MAALPYAEFSVSSLMGIEYVHQPLLADAANADSGADRDATPGAADSLRRGSDASADANAADADAAASSSGMVDGAKATLAFARSCYICKSRCRRCRRLCLCHLVAAVRTPAPGAAERGRGYSE